MKPEALAVGSKVWRWDENRRVYRDPKPGDMWSKGSPIWREHWSPCLVIGETSRSWLIGHSMGGTVLWRLPKNGEWRGWATSATQIDRDAWVEGHRHKLAEAVRDCGDYDILGRVAEAIGYVEAAP